jgi:flavin-dependent dehydrogenase
MHDVIIVGGGPAGCACAILLAESGLRVLVLEAKHMPREKLCGEFIAPESFPTLNRLGILERVLDTGQKLTRLTLCSSGGGLVDAKVCEVWGSGWAIGLSRARLDQILFERAREVGASCIEGISVKQCLGEKDSPAGVEGIQLEDGESCQFRGSVVIDGSGRNSRLTVDGAERRAGRFGSRLYALKVHLEPIAEVSDQVELYFFPDGYGGVSRVEDGLINLCFIANETIVKQAAGDPHRIVNQTILRNPRARVVLKGFRTVGKWHGAGPLKFGPRRLARAGIITIGDASGLIDPFTGSGIYVALRTGEIAAESIIEAVGKEPHGLSSNLDSGPRLVDQALQSYRRRYEQEIIKPMRAAAFLRRIAFSVWQSDVAASLMSKSPRLAQRVIRATQGGIRTLSGVGKGYLFSRR